MLNFKNCEFLNNRSIITLKKEECSDQIQNPDEIKITQQIEVYIEDIIKNLQNENPQSNIFFDLEQAIKLIDPKNQYLNDYLLSKQLPQILNNLLQQEEVIYDFKKTAFIYWCIAELLVFDGLRSFFMSNNIAERALTHVSHEDNFVTRESLHILSILMKDIVNNGTFVDEHFIYHVCQNIGISFEHTKYSLKIFLTIAKNLNSCFNILDDAIPTLFKLYKEFTYTSRFDKIIECEANPSCFRSDIDKLYNTKYDLFKKYIVQTIYYITKSNPSIYFKYKYFFHHIFYSINGFSTTKTDSDYILYIFKLLLLIINNDEKEAFNCVKYIGNLNREEDINNISFYYDIYYYFLQNSDYSIIENLLEIMIFNIYHLPNSFYEFCSNPEFIHLLLKDFIEDTQFLLKAITLKFLSILAQISRSTIETLICENFINLASGILDMEDISSTFNYFFIVDRMLQYSVAHSKKDAENIAKFISESPEIYENMDRIIDQFPLELDDLKSDPNSDQKLIDQKQNTLSLCIKIKNFCCGK